MALPSELYLRMMKLLLTSAGIKNTSIHNALVGLLGKPISECKALFIPTAIYPFNGGAYMAYQAISGNTRSPLVQLGWKSVGVLELTALPGIDKTIWQPQVQEADAILAWGGDPLYLAYWMQQSGLAALLPSLARDVVYVGVSAGSMAASAVICETYSKPAAGNSTAETREEVVFDTPQGPVNRVLTTGKGAGWVDFALIPHYLHPDHPDASGLNVALWAAKVPAPVYAIDDESAVVVRDGVAEVVSEGEWKLF